MGDRINVPLGVMSLYQLIHIDPNLLQVPSDIENNDYTH